MKRMSVLAAGVGAAGLSVAVYAAVPAKVAPPIATYWMDVATQSGLGAGMAGGGGRPSMSQIMGMMSGGSSVAHTLDLRLASKDTAAAPQADHWVPPGLPMGQSLPLGAPIRQAQPRMAMPYQQPQRRMLIYLGC